MSPDERAEILARIRADRLERGGKPCEPDPGFVKRMVDAELRLEDPGGAMMDNEVAPKGAIFVCGVCGKRSRDRFGDQAIDRDWDVSCVLWATLVREDSIELGPHGRVIKGEPWNPNPNPQ